MPYNGAPIPCFECESYKSHKRGINLGYDDAIIGRQCINVVGEGIVFVKCWSDQNGFKRKRPIFLYNLIHTISIK